MGNEEAVRSQPIIAKRFDMGVTTIQSYFYTPNIFVMGSYNENGTFSFCKVSQVDRLLILCSLPPVYFWDQRNMKTPLSETNVGGGVWRIKTHPYNPKFLLVASMHSGFNVLKVDPATCRIFFSFFFFRTPHSLTITTGATEPILNYTKHNSLGYGADWCYDQKLAPANKPLLSTSSFYDHSQHLWQIELPESE